MVTNPKLSKDEHMEQQLLQGMLSNIPKAWKHFFTLYDRLIYRCITRVTSHFPGIINQEDIREIYANVIVNLLRNDKKKLRSYDPQKGCKLSSWIGLITINTTYDYLRHLSRQPYHGILNENHESVLPVESPFEKTAAREQLKKIKETLGDFSEKDRQFLSLYYLEEKEPEEIAAIMGISIKTVYTKKHKIRSRLCQRFSRPPFAEATL